MLRGVRIASGAERVVRELVDVDDTGTGEDVLDADSTEPAGELADHGQLARRPRREVGVPSFGRAGHQPAVDIEEESLTKTGAGSENRRVAVPRRPPAVERRQFVRLEHADAVRQRFQVVQDKGLAEAERLADRDAVYFPWNVGQVRDMIGDCPGDAEACRVDGGAVSPLRLQELCDHRLEPGKVERHEFGNVHRRGPCRASLEQAKQCLRAADVACKEHGVLSIQSPA